MEAGDILLVEGINKISKPLIVAQKLIYKSTKSSHVALNLGDGTLIHATNDGGVHLTFIKDELATCKDNWRVIRNNKITEKEKEEIVSSGLYFLRQGYNKKFMGNGSESSSFCSELVAKIYLKSGINLFSGKKPSRISPAHFDKVADLAVDWDDVTTNCHKLLKTIDENEHQYRSMFTSIDEMIKKREFCNKSRNAVFDGMAILTEVTGDPAHENLASSIKEYYKKNRLLNFWDED